MKMAAMPKLCVTSDNFCDLWDAIDEKDHTWIYECVAQWDLKIFEPYFVWDTRNRLRPNDPEEGSELLLRVFFAGRKWMYQSLPPTHGPFYLLYTVFCGDLLTSQTIVSLEKM